MCVAIWNAWGEVVQKESVNIWLQLLGFERNDPDKGVSRFLDSTGFIPDSVCGLLFNADFVHLNRRMDEEYELFPDNCSYRGVIKNRERERQPWTNYDLKELVKSLKQKGIDFYAGIMGCYIGNRFHYEWLSDHPEMQSFRIEGDGELCCLKHLKDGRLYEDFFAERLVETLCDYDMAGVHLSDAFCPINVLYSGDWSTDMIMQFLEHSNIKLPVQVVSTIGDDSVSARRVRHEYIWGNLRKEWIQFYEWRWQCFFKKVCDAVHSVGKKVWVLGMYCTDPFETRYIYGFDCKKVMDAGVDCITANILPTSVTLEKPELPYYFHRMHTILPLLKAHVGERKILSMIGVQDASEEWSVLEHFPVMLERDIVTSGSYVSGSSKGFSPASDGLFFCLGDGISADGWSFLKKCTDCGFDNKNEVPMSPMMLWSEHQHDAILTEYIKNRRASAHKQCFEVEKAGALLGGTVVSDGLSGFEGALFVPNYDLLSKKEQKMLNEAKFMWLGTATCEAEMPSGVTYTFDDVSGDSEMRAFVCNFQLSQELEHETEKLISENDETASRRNEPERKIYPLYEELPFAKISHGFIKAIAIVLNEMCSVLTSVGCNLPSRVTKTDDGHLKLVIYNPFDNGYVTAVVTSKLDMESVKVLSSFPLLPPRFLSDGEQGMYYDFSKKHSTKKRFTVKLAPSGVTVVDINSNLTEMGK